MEMLMPATAAGANVYHASSAPPPAPSQPPAAFVADSDEDIYGPSVMAEDPSSETSDVEEVG
jgi:hypothetical protein